MKTVDDLAKELNQEEIEAIEYEVKCFIKSSRNFRKRLVNALAEAEKRLVEFDEVHDPLFEMPTDKLCEAVRDMSRDDLKMGWKHFDFKHDDSDEVSDRTENPAWIFSLARKLPTQVLRTFAHRVQQELERRRRD